MSTDTAIDDGLSCRPDSCGYAFKYRRSINPFLGAFNIPPSECLALISICSVCLPERFQAVHHDVPDRILILYKSQKYNPVFYSNKGYEPGKNRPIHGIFAAENITGTSSEPKHLISQTQVSESLQSSFLLIFLVNAGSNSFYQDIKNASYGAVPCLPLSIIVLAIAIHSFCSKNVNNIIQSSVIKHTVAADDITWVILPYVYEQYGN